MNIALRQVLLGLGVATLLATAACSGAEGRKARYMARGDEYVAAQNYEKARIEYANALQVDPKDAKARFAAGQVAEKLGKARDALGNYQVAVETDAEFLPARAALARLYLLGGVPDKALELVEPALVKNPEDPQLRTVRGAVRAQKGDKEGALADAEAAVATAPGDEYALALMASLYRREGRSADAIKALSTGVEKSPKSQDLRIILAELLMNEDRRPEAETQLRALICRTMIRPSPKRCCARPRRPIPVIPVCAWTWLLCWLTPAKWVRRAICSNCWRASRRPTWRPEKTCSAW